jgi:hypothetical protein
MAKADEQVQAADVQDDEIVFGTWKSAEKANPYTDIVKQLAEAPADENGDDPSVTIKVNAKEAANRQLLFQKAANAIGKTARLRHTDASGSAVIGQTAKGRDIREGVIKFTFTLSQKHSQRRGKGENETPAAE